MIDACSSDTVLGSALEAFGLGHIGDNTNDITGKLLVFSGVYDRL
jgi:hypothetical protein